MEYLIDELDTHIKEKAIPTILQYQGGLEPAGVAPMNDATSESNISCSNDKVDAFILHVADQLKRATKSKVYTVLSSHVIQPL